MSMTIKEINEQFKRDTMAPTIALSLLDESCIVFDSKVGGTPYLPPGFEYPKGSDGNPLVLLAQLNFASLPKLPDFPESGLLQFYIANEDVMGLDFDNPVSQKDFRVIYHEDIIADESQLSAPPDLGLQEDHYLPFEKEMKISAKLNQMPLHADDFRFPGQYIGLYNEKMGTELETPWELDESDDLCEEFAFGDYGNHRIGGYAYFTQTDPREYNEQLKDYTIMLLQIDSQTDEKGNWDIIWGDCGVGNFFITPAQLKALDFSKVLYNWDCC